MVRAHLLTRISASFEQSGFAGAEPGKANPRLSKVFLVGPKEVQKAGDLDSPQDVRVREATRDEHITPPLEPKRRFSVGPEPCAIGEFDGERHPCGV
jgi:hypothetical protein